METSSGALREKEYSSKSRPRILVVDDEKDIRQLLIDCLSGDFEILEATDGSEALLVIEKTIPDLVILDIMMPGTNGFQVLRRLRQTPDIPVIVLSARIDTTDKVEAFELGANDYVTKPFIVEELIARIKAILNRKTRDRHTIQSGYDDGYLRIDFTAHRIIVDGKEVAVVGHEYDLLEQLVLHEGTGLKSQYLLEKVWGPQYISDMNIIYVAIARIRSRIERNQGCLTYNILIYI
jgi:DNA-binding response OmpR family regulator